MGVNILLIYKFNVNQYIKKRFFVDYQLVPTKTLGVLNR
jgi:hypothetical protein